MPTANMHTIVIIISVFFFQSFRFDVQSIIIYAPMNDIQKSIVSPSRVVVVIVVVR